MSLTLGIHIGHDGGAVLMRDDSILAACSEERLARYKHANGWWNALRYCLDYAGKALSDVDLVVFSNSGPPLVSGFNGGLAKWCKGPLKTCSLDHHLSHAIGAFAMSGMSEALVYVGDAGGNHSVTESAFLFDRNRYTEIMKSAQWRSRSKGLGTTYEAFTNFLGFNDQESGKTMALAAYGQGDTWPEDLFEIKANGEVIGALDKPHFWGVIDWARSCAKDIGQPFPDSRTGMAQDVAAFIQRSFENALLKSISQILANQGSHPVVLTGGIGLNCVANTFLRTHLQSDCSFFPLCSDVGLPLGNAVFGQLMTERHIPSLESSSLLLGKQYSENEIDLALSRHPDTVPPGSMRMSEMVCHKSNNISRDAAQLLTAGKVIAWFQGRSEFGPRALGARSILANPRIVGVRDLLNRKIKQREWFRPFGPSVRAEEIGSYLKCPRFYPHMIEAPLLSELGKIAMGECVHIDGTARIQTVEPSVQPRYAELLAEVGRSTGHGVLLNTSFNVREPIVETPGDAIATFLRSDLDALVIEDYLCTRV